MRFLHLIVVAALVTAAVYVYKIKFDSALQAERVAKLRTDLRKERDKIAALRAEWAHLDNPTRIQGLVQRHLTLRPVEATQFDNLAALPERPANAQPDDNDPIGSIIEQTVPESVTGSIDAPAPAR